MGRRIYHFLWNAETAHRQTDANHEAHASSQTRILWHYKYATWTGCL